MKRETARQATVERGAGLERKKEEREKVDALNGNLRRRSDQYGSTQLTQLAQTKTQTKRQTGRQTGRQKAGRSRNTGTHKHAGRHRERQRERQRERENRETETEIFMYIDKRMQAEG